MNNIDREKIIFILGNLKQSEKTSILMQRIQDMNDIEFEKFCEENDCSMFSEIFEIGTKHKDTTLNWCLKQTNVKLLMFENVFYFNYLKQ